MDFRFKALQANDPDVYEAILKERTRQVEGLELIASENYTSAAVLACQGTVLTNKYAEGYPGRRYYGGCEEVDVVEQLAIDRAKELFGAEFANVQPHCGASANMAVYFACLQPGDTILGMDLAHGGHLTHGSPVNFSGKLYNVIHYGVDRETETIDYDNLAKMAKESKPKLILSGASAYPRTIDFAKIGEIAKDVGSIHMTDMAHIAGLIAGGVHPSPVPHADFVTSTSHKTLRGPRAGFVLCKEEFGKKLNSSVFPGMQGGPLMHVIAGKAVIFKEANSPEFKEYAKQIVSNAKALADTLQSGGFHVSSGGTDNHLVLIDATSKHGLTGKIAEKALDEAGITVNKNMIPFDQRKPLDPSGIRIGTAAMTTRGLKEDQMKQIGEWIIDVFDLINEGKDCNSVREEVRQFAKQYPVPGIQSN